MYCIYTILCSWNVMFSSSPSLCHSLACHVRSYVMHILILFYFAFYCYICLCTSPEAAVFKIKH